MPQEYRESDPEDDYRGEISWDNSMPMMEPSYEDYSSENESSEDDDNEGPEDVSNSMTKVSALNHIQETAEAIKQQKELQKEKRRKRNELLLSQKQAKNKRFSDLESKRLPAEFLEEIGKSSEFSEENVSSNDSLTNKSKKRNKESKKIDEIGLPSTTTEFKIKNVNRLNNSVVSKSAELQLIKEKYLRGTRKREKTGKALAKLEKQAKTGLNKLV